MLSSLRANLLLALCATLGLITILSALWIVSSLRHAALLNKIHESRNAQEVYERVLLQGVWHFKQLADDVILNSPAGTETRNSAKSLDKALGALAEARAKETAVALSEEDRENEIQESHRDSEIFQLVASIRNEFQAIKATRSQEPLETTLSKLTPLLEIRIDKEFRGLLSNAIEDEREEIIEGEKQDAALFRYMTLAIAILSLTGILVIALFGYRMYRWIVDPLETLTSSVRAIGKEDFTYRMDRNGPSEFKVLGRVLSRSSKALHAQHTKLTRARDDLEETVKRRTKDYDEANRKLKAQQAARTRLLSDISHELRTPLTAIRGEAEIALRGADKPAEQYREGLKRIAGLSSQLGRIVDDLLTVARSESGSLVMQIDSLNMSELLSDVKLTAHSMSRGRKVELATQVNRHVLVAGDRQRLMQLFLILVDNAVRYSEEKGRVEILLKEQDGWATVSVFDQGVGIPESDRELLFDRFFRGKEARRLSPDGLGLGLFVAEAIVKAHSGEILVDSEPGRGTTFTVRLPRMRRTRGHPGYAAAAG